MRFDLSHLSDVAAGRWHCLPQAVAFDAWCTATDEAADLRARAKVAFERLYLSTAAKAMLAFKVSHNATTGSYILINLQRCAMSCKLRGTCDV